MAAKNNSGSFTKHVLLIILIYAAIIWVVLRWVSNYTQHGVMLKVPNLIGKMPAEIKKMEASYDLEFIIIDSTYNADKKRGAAVEQNPEPDALVKQDRKVYITINALKPPMAKMPKLVDMSLRQATAILESYGLTVGNLKYEPDFAKDAVLKQLYRGVEIMPGTAIIQESKIDLVLGDGLKSEQINLPNLLGLTLKEATSQLRENKLNVGSTLFDKSSKDTTKAMVYRQFPSYQSQVKVNIGRTVDLFFTSDVAKIKNAQDSLNKKNIDEEDE